ncbi:GNAT family N-acetyltransferase [Rhodococcus sp. WMMA185]|uniref:GNAT family N-acetyltransferase n=1 Tax=Rhodococcus sp. WMMA185 TaxID=679318 RepID=UPI000878358E|nr:GNAT family protein [Rhodococcus sp. WMMA185]AOW93375.1 GNAT family N-acetyltransferase [Rhodococcus sp. WMMA185]
MFVVALNSEKVWLRPPVPTDIDEICAVCEHGSIAVWTTLPAPYTSLDAERFVRHTAPSGWSDRSPTWTLRESEDGPVVGMIGLGARDATAGEIGYFLSPAARSRGLMTAAMRLVCDFAFRSDGMALERIDWRAFVGNRASAAVARRVGFRFEGVQRAGLVQRGVRRDTWMAGLLADDPRRPVDGWPAASCST